MTTIPKIYSKDQFFSWFYMTIVNEYFKDIVSYTQNEGTLLSIKCTSLATSFPWGLVLENGSNLKVIFMTFNVCILKLRRKKNPLLSRTSHRGGRFIFFFFNKYNYMISMDNAWLALVSCYKNLLEWLMWFVTILPFATKSSACTGVVIEKRLLISVPIFVCLQ